MNVVPGEETASKAGDGRHGKGYIASMVRTLPSAQETVRILATRRTRPAPGPPPVAGRALRATLRGLDARFGKGMDGLKARWREIVGPELARRTEPTKLVKSRTGGPAALELRVEGPSAAIIQHRAGDILDRVNLFLGSGSVDRLRIVQGPLRRAAERAAGAAETARRRLKTPLDAAVEEALAESLTRFPDSALKAALTRLGREVLRGEPPPEPPPPPRQV